MTSPNQLNHHSNAPISDRRPLIDLNTAAEHELAALASVGPARIQALVHRRPFRSWDDVARVPGISPIIIARLKRSGAELLS